MSLNNMLPNTTPTPNELYNGEMKKMNDTELRVVLIVTRATLGWEEDHKTGMRKQEDWISRSQLIEKSGRSDRAISSAVDSCVKAGWIEARTKEGELLNTAEKRIMHGSKIFYRLGRVFLDRIETTATNAEVAKPSQLTTATTATNDTQPPQKVHTTKETLTKETIQKNIATQDVAGKNLNLLINEFKSVNPSYERLFKNTTQRAAVKRLAKKFGSEKVAGMIRYSASISGDKFAPGITTPCQLEDKLGQLMAYAKKNQVRIAEFNSKE